ncbi:MAG: PfkB family carbohydrate kinase, partial [Erysipelotrichales bacterium]|nr:PfkB family carbohydrate kinase [Erysipelotrichales bacterium]
MSIYVIGGANIDIQGTPFEKLKYKDSNPGIISYSFGGVARNVAENLARLGDNVNFISVL